MPRFAITTPIFYVNAPPHIGHAYAVVAADVLARSHRLRGDGVFFLTGTDEHGAKIAEAAAAAGKSPQAFADEIAATFQHAWKALDVIPDDFIRTTEARHERGVRAALSVLHERGVLYEKSYQGLYCTGCEKFLTEKDLDSSGRCPLHNRVPEKLEERNWFFRLSQFSADVQRAIETDALRISPEARKNEVLGLFRQGLEDFSVSRPKERVPWGIPLPFADTQTCYVWVDALLNYVTALGYGAENSQFPIPNSQFKKFWPADLHIIGQDILKFHAVYWPALLLALDLPLPKEIFVHGFFTVNGQKISKSLHNTIDPLQLVQRYGSDATRFLLLSQFPFGSSGDVQSARFDEQYEAILANTIGNLVSRIITLLQKFSDSKIPDASPDASVSADVILPAPHRSGATGAGPARRDSLVKRVEGGSGAKDLSSVASDLDSAVNGPVRLAQELNQYADRAAPWKETDPAKRATALRTLADGVVRLALLAEPVLPNTSAAIQRAFPSRLGLPSRLPSRLGLADTDGRAETDAETDGVANRQLPTPGTPVQPTDPPVLFPRVTSS